MDVLRSCGMTVLIILAVIGAGTVFLFVTCVAALSTGR